MRKQVKSLLAELETAKKRRDKVSIYLKLGYLYFHNSFYNKAKEYALLAKNLCNKKDDILTFADAELLLSKIYFQTYRYDISLKHCLDAITAFEKAKEIVYLARSYNQLGNIYSHLDKIEPAKENYLRAIQLYPPDNDEIANTYNNLGIIFAESKEPQKSFSFFEKALERFTQASDFFRVCVCRNNMAEIARNCGEYEKALEYLQACEPYLKFVKQKDVLAEHSLNYAITYQELGKNKEARKYFDITESTLKHNLVQPKIKLEYTQKRADFLAQQADFRSAYELLRKTLVSSKELWNEELALKIAELETKHQLAETNKEAHHYKLMNQQLHLLNEKLAISNRALEESKYQIEQKNKEIEEQNLELSRSNQAKDGILSIVAHDLKNPLSIILTAIELLRNEIDQNCIDNIETDVAIIEKTAHSMTILIDDLLEINRLDSHEYRLDMQLLPLQSIIRDSVNMINEVARKKGIEFDLHLPNRNMYLNLNHERFNQILTNILSNAIKFSYRNSTIKISVQQTLFYAVLVIQDFGIGIPQNKLETVFEKFTRFSRKGTEGEKTTGLGLSIVKRLVELHNGKIEVRSKENEGTSFIITLTLPDQTVFV